MDNSRYLELLEPDGHLLRLAATGNLAAAVPTCPGWTVRDAVVQTAEVLVRMLDGDWTHDPQPSSSGVVVVNAGRTVASAPLAMGTSTGLLAAVRR